MEWQQILSFYHVAKLGSFTKAAEATFRTQSAISQQIRNLEVELECQLLERIGRRRIRLTSAGEKFFNFSNCVLEKYDALSEELKEARDLQIGQLRMAASFTTLYHLFPSALKKYIRSFPNVKLIILDRPQQEILSLIKTGDIEFGLVLESNIKADLTAIRWKKVKSVVMTPMGHPLTRVKRIKLDQIADYPLILPPKNLRYRSALEKKFKERRIDYHILMESSNVELSALYVEMGLGISFATIVEDLPGLKDRKLEFLPLDHVFKPDNIVIAMRKDKILSSYKNAFIKILFEEFSA